MVLIQLHANDNVAIASRDVARNTRIGSEQGDGVLLEPVPLGHKVAVRPIASGEPIVKFGQWIGFATEPIAIGRWVHSHNLEAGEFARDAVACSAVPPDPEPILGHTFLGYRRPDGKAGTRNYVAIVSNVNCSASVCRAVARRFGPENLAAIPARGRRRCVHARQWLRIPTRRRASSDPEPNAGRHYKASKYRGIHSHWPWVRAGIHGASYRTGTPRADRRGRRQSIGATTGAIDARCWRYTGHNQRGVPN